MKDKLKRQKIIRANQVIIEDVHGKSRIIIDALFESGPSITLLSETNAEIRISVGNDSHGSVSIRNPTGKTGACIAVTENGESGVDLYDKNGFRSITTESGGQAKDAEIRAGNKAISKKSKKRKTG